MDNLQLTKLAQKAKGGDLSAFEKIYIELSPEIYSIAYEITKNKDESQDLMQDCFAAAIENIGSLKDPDKIKNWLIRIAANKSRDYIKKKKPSVLTEEQYVIIENIEEEDIAAIPEPSLETDERIEEVNEMLQQLTEDKRLCLLLRYKHDMSYAEIAQELEISENAVKSRISRAKDDIEKEAEKRKKKGLPLFGVAPFGLVIFALKKSADITAASFAGSAAQGAAFAGITAASQTVFAASATTATTTTTTAAASGAASAAGTTATAATGIGAKVAAMSVAQKVVAGIAAASIATGSAVGTTVVVKNKIQSETTTATAHIEEYTTAPDYGFEEETIFIPPVSETESSVSEYSTSQNSTSSVKQSSTISETEKTEKSTVANRTTTKLAAKATTTKQTTAKSATTTKIQTTTKPTSTEEEETTTTVKTTTTKEATAATTKAVTSTTAAATTSAEADTTTDAATQAASPATVTVTIYSSGSSETTQKTLSFDVGDSITGSVIEERLMSDYRIDAMADDIDITAESGGSYTATAYEI